jgi:plasmid replication initiation protein
MSKLVVKDNSLIQASYTLGLVEQRLMLLAIVGARETGHGIDAETLLTVRAEDYAKHFGVARQTAYQALADAVETLFNRRATVDVYDKRKDKMRPMTVRWVTAMQYEENEACITLRFGHEVVPLITRLEANFTSYELQQITGLKSAYAVRLYELLMQWKVAGKTPLFELNEFRNQLGIVESEYQRMDVFKRRVLDISVNQINENTDINVTYEQHKKGRVITGFSFSFRQKPIPKTIELDLTRDPNTLDMFTNLTDGQIDALLSNGSFAGKYAEIGEDTPSYRKRVGRLLRTNPEQFDLKAF